jgi:hypothetical protein
MTEICYSKGKKVILRASKNNNGKWICRFTISGFPGSRDPDYASEEYPTEWEATTAAWKNAKSVIDSPKVGIAKEGDMK